MLRRGCAGCHFILTRLRHSGARRLTQTLAPPNSSLVSLPFMRLGHGFCPSKGSLQRRLGPSVPWRPAGQALPFIRLVSGNGFASAALRFLLPFALASVWAARPAASSSPAGSLQQCLAALRVALAAILAIYRRSSVTHLASPVFFASATSFGGLSWLRGAAHNPQASGGANPSFNRTCFGVAAPGFISFSPGSATLAHAG